MSRVKGYAAILAHNHRHLNPAAPGGLPDVLERARQWPAPAGGAGPRIGEIVALDGCVGQGVIVGQPPEGDGEHLQAVDHPGGELVRRTFAARLAQ